jgi:hypothetical protein
MHAGCNTRLHHFGQLDEKQGRFGMITIPAGHYKAIIIPVERFRQQPADIGLCFSACIFLTAFVTFMWNIANHH